MIKHLGSYGSREGLWELAVLKFDKDGDFNLDYSTKITNDVISHQTKEDIETLLVQIKNQKVKA